ncbi:hypothetical protein L1D61_25435 [Vibrio mediterranei]|uniref:Uncharacterized protein n=1 Tax=Vibrio mediterranei TaxID=689 RepID=A0A3G4VL35_9VIBR|nr:hypothetical protein [Vibrio mediterranei]AYV25085.1 hypothetical protein ECB94_27715 [Vibrio mediterranei]MCG9790498.1 hypothetical protein [Vibrio mediterranei]
MWLIEFVDGHLQGVSLPLQASFYLTGNKEVRKNNQLSVPEYLPSDTELLFEIKDQTLFVKGFYRSDKLKKLVANRVYRFKGLSFFLYQEGNRNPKLRRFVFRKYQPVVAFTLVLNLVVVIASFAFFYNQQQTLIAGYLNMLGSGFIKDGKLNVFDKTAMQTLPDFWQKNLKLVNSDQYIRLAQLDVQLVSSQTGKVLDGRVVTKFDRDEVQVDTYEEDNQIMLLFGEYGLTFSKQGSDWFVSDLAKATLILNNAGLSSLNRRLKTRVEQSELISSREFPYSIFYSTTTGGYIYDQTDRYWEGSTVPNLGVIQLITRDKIVFKNANKTRVYLIQP